MKLFEKIQLEEEIERLRKEVVLLRSETNELRSENYLLHHKITELKREVPNEVEEVKNRINARLEKFEEEYKGHFVSLEGESARAEKDYREENSIYENRYLGIERIFIPKCEFVYVRRLGKK